MWRYVVSVPVRIGLAAVWLIAGGIKAVDPDQSEIAVKAYHLFPDSTAYAVSLVLPMAEIALGLLLLIGLAVRPAAIASAVLLVLLIAAIVSVWARGYTIDCGCFGGGGEADVSWRNYLTEILRDVGFLALAAWLIVFPRSHLALGPGSRPRAARDDHDDDSNDPATAAGVDDEMATEEKH
ncbi:MauE/DoxX family redox-associated membrane protein [Williamsia muralis]|uniref:MauE/DoxX family redox-associated membrane protein n=1 Tax=Williamsia marianensis TaxID=85044 RepID=UPI000A000DB6|nr:MauE/DoxX family redox-associated membrane protein [Williamsia muralis]